MIRLSGNSTKTRRLSRRRRISNQLAAFAAVMLFASTQVDAPEPREPDNARPASPVSQQAGAEVASGREKGNEPGRDVVQQTVSTSRAKPRGISLSLFQFRG